MGCGTLGTATTDTGFWMLDAGLTVAEHETEIAYEDVDEARLRLGRGKGGTGHVQAPF